MEIWRYEMWRFEGRALNLHISYLHISYLQISTSPYLHIRRSEQLSEQSPELFAHFFQETAPLPLLQRQPL
jgi:hypothetical protein